MLDYKWSQSLITIPTYLEMVFHIDHFYNEIMAWKICFTAINSQNKEHIFGEICSSI